MRFLALTKYEPCRRTLASRLYSLYKVNKYYENTAFHFDYFIKKIQTDDLQIGENK